LSIVYKGLGEAFLGLPISVQLGNAVDTFFFLLNSSHGNSLSLIYFILLCLCRYPLHLSSRVSRRHEYAQTQNSKRRSIDCLIVRINAVSFAFIRIYRSKLSFSARALAPSIPFSELHSPKTPWSRNVFFCSIAREPLRHRFASPSASRIGKTTTRQRSADKKKVCFVSPAAASPIAFADLSCISSGPNLW
jgi:hypothetical protein